MNKIKLIFFGSSAYSLIILKQIIKSPLFDLQTVVSKIDKAQGRQKIITPNPVVKFCQDKHLPLLQTDTFDTKFISTLKKIKPDLIIVVAFGPPYFTQEIIDIPRFKIVNIHPSPLPKYRGATPGPWQIINGETNSSVTFFKIDALPDHGPIIHQIPFAIDQDETASSFYNKAFNLAAKNLNIIISNYIKNPTNLQIQNHQEKTYFPRFTKDSALINWSWPPIKIYRFINALSDWPIAWTYIRNQQNKTMKMKIFSATIQNNELIPQQIQIEGKNKNNWSEIKKYYRLITS
jgi:methionyl-tRNA formyltransferase